MGGSKNLWKHRQYFCHGTHAGLVAMSGDVLEFQVVPIICRYGYDMKGLVTGAFSALNCTRLVYGSRFC